MELITSLQNQRIKDAAKLRDRRQREKQRRILIDGAREIGRAVASGVVLVEAFVCEPLLHTAEAHELVEQLPATGAVVRYVTPEVFGKLAFGERAEGVLAVAQPPKRELHDLQLPATAVVAVLEGIEKPGNVGAVLRSADGAGVSAVIVAAGSTDLYNPNCIRASLGTLFTLPVCEATSETALDWLRGQQFQIYAAQVGAANNYTDVDYRGRAAIALGSEAHGLSPLWQAADVVPVKLPMRGVADSLNVSAAAAVLFYEAQRQRQG